MGQLAEEQIPNASEIWCILIPLMFSESSKIVSYGKHLQLFAKVVKIHKKGQKMVTYPSFDPPQSPHKILRILQTCSNFS